MRNNILTLFAAFAISLPLSSKAQEKIFNKQDNPRLIVGIIVDQFRYEDLQRYYHRLQDKGIKRLLKQGTFYTSNFYQNLLTQAPVSQASIVTGAPPSLHGIVAREWYEPLQDHIISCIYDAKSRVIGSKAGKGHKSPVMLKAPAFTNQIKLNTNFSAKVYSVGFKDMDAVLSAGQMADAAFWFDTKAGSWVSSSYYIDKLPEWVRNFNRKHLADTLMQQKWERLHPLATYTASRSDRNNYEPGFGRFANGLPYRLSWLSRNDQDYRILNYTPYADEQTIDFARTLLRQQKLGKDTITDYLAISLTSTEGIADLFGPFSVEHEDAFMRMDKQIAKLLTYLDKHYKRRNILVFLTGAHGAPLLPEYHKAQGVNAGYFTHKSAMALLKAYLRAKFGDGNWVKYYTQQQIFLNRNLIEDKEVKLSTISKAAARFITQFSGVANAIAAEEMLNKNFTSGIYRDFRNNYYPNRSGDILINLEPNWTERFGGITHGNYNYDSHVPLIWYGWHIKSKHITHRVSPMQIAPTITHILGLGYPAATNSMPLEEIINNK